MDRARCRFGLVRWHTSDFALQPRTCNLIASYSTLSKHTEDYKKTVSIAERKQAIKTACQFARANDIILVAAKGHESYQEINGERLDFDDFKMVSELLKALNK